MKQKSKNKYNQTANDRTATSHTKIIRPAKVHAASNRTATNNSPNIHTVNTAPKMLTGTIKAYLYFSSNHLIIFNSPGNELKSIKVKVLFHRQAASDKEIPEDLGQQLLQTWQIAKQLLQNHQQ